MPAPEPDEFSPRPGGWHDHRQVEEYLDRMDRLAPRQIGEQMLVDLLPSRCERVLDLGTGDGRLLARVLEARPSVVHATGVDVSAPMLELARSRFAGDDRVELREHDLRSPVTSLGTFDVIVSGFAIHHLEDDRKRELFAEVAAMLRPRGLFANLEVVRSATPELHARFLELIGRTGDDPEDRLGAVEDQLGWMREAPLANVDCAWRWRGFALLAGERSG